ncbi:gliding motility-associated C-terminal domain-containing protein, partial [Flavobacterium amniphilum]|uniref:gliding motility-associated C-terminal domain-containing protein n=1 Tax=Flavobacterium amniphilum TaxID=1834035 RepID=UPI002029DA43
DGTVTVAGNTPAGSYNVEYTICEVTNPSNCDTVISVVTVTAPVIDAVTETYGPINGNTGGTTPTVVLNDTLNGNPVVIGTNPGQVTLTPVSVPTGLTLNPDGTVTVAGNTPAGSYNVEYTICEVTNPSNCDTVISVVTVTAPVIDAVTETYGPISGNTGGTTPTVVLNDTLNGNPVVIGTNPGQVTLTPVSVPTGLTLNPDGTVTVAGNTPAGSYNVEYTICEVTNPSNCDTVISVVTVTAPVIDANDDSETMQSGSNGGTAVIDVFENDTLDGNPTGLSEVTLTVDAPDPTGHIVLNPDGTVYVNPGTPAGTYQITYTICEILNPGNCSTAVVTVIVNTIEDIDIYTHMTPNGDGDNDVFYIDGITKYPNNTVEIYNRWGILVYQAKKYNNTDVAFDGRSRGRTTVSEDDNLPEGTYYYIVRYTKTDGVTKEKAGYLYINR